MSFLRQTLLGFSFLPTLVVADPPAPSFRHQDVDTNIAIGYGLAISDVDGDGRPDILLADKRSVQWYRNPDWTKHTIAENLTPQDNVCIAVEDLDGDGKCEIAIGAGWNPSETIDASKSGAVFYLIAPEDRTKKWEPIRLSHEPTVHRMHWVKAPGGSWELIVKPLHGRGNVNNQGAGAKVFAYAKPANPKAPWKLSLVSDFTHASHNFQPIDWDGRHEGAFVAGAKEGIFKFVRRNGGWEHHQLSDQWTGEVRDGRLPGGQRFLATIEPMHGNVSAVYTEPGNERDLWPRLVLDETLQDGHAVVVGDFLGTGSDQIVVGWRAMPPRGTPGVRMFTPFDDAGKQWRATDLSGLEVAVEDMKGADLNGDGRLDLILAGRGTKNLRILWNETSR